MLSILPLAAPSCSAPHRSGSIRSVRTSAFVFASFSSSAHLATGFATMAAAITDCSSPSPRSTCWASTIRLSATCVRAHVRAMLELTGRADLVRTGSEGFMRARARVMMLVRPMWMHSRALYTIESTSSRVGAALLDDQIPPRLPILML